MDKTSQGTAYSEIGEVPVKADTDYICEAWIKCNDSDVDKVAIEAKHHNNVTHTGDIKLGNAKPESEASDKGWRKVKLAFTTKEYNKISLSVNSDAASVLLDDVSLYERYTIAKKSWIQPPLIQLWPLLLQRKSPITQKPPGRRTGMRFWLPDWRK